LKLNIIAMLLCWVSFMPNVTEADCHTKAFMLSVIYAKCHMLTALYAERRGALKKTAKNFCWTL
jgi:hypothetical protein